MNISEWFYGAMGALFGENVLAANVLFAVLAFDGVLWLTVFCVLAARRRYLRKKEERQRHARQLQFTLPDRENSFIRARLHTALAMTETEGARGEERECEYGRSSCSYALKLMEKLRETPLSTAERLRLEGIEDMLLACDRKESWSAKEIDSVGEAFSAILKLSAKYAV